MEQKRLPFRFRIPWISGASVPRPAAESSSRRLKKEPPKLPFRPPGIAPPQPQQHSSSRPPTTSSVTNESPPSTAQTQVNSSLTTHATQSPSPFTSNRTHEVSTSTSDEATRSYSSTSQQEKQKMAQQCMKSPLKHAGKLGNKEKSATTSTAAALKTPTHTEKLGTHANGGDSKTHSEEQRKSYNKQLSRSFRADKKEPETVERKMMFATSNPTEKGIKVVSSKDPTASNLSSISPKMPLPLDGVKAPLKKEIKDISNCAHKLAIGHSTQAIDEIPISVITLAGDNRGAAMHVGKSIKKERSIHIHRAYKKNPEQSPEVTTDGEESSEEESDNSMKKDEVGNAYVNCNIQSLNNSLMSQSSINDRDPGVHLIYPQKHTESVKRDDKRGLENRKVEFKVTRDEGSSCRHRVRRRCLRGLFAEPSDSDPDNPNKPQRHGCKFKCGDT